MAEAAPFDWAVASWNGRGDLIEVSLRVRVSGAWSPWFSFGRWSSTGPRASVAGQAHEPFGRVDTDTLLLARPGRHYPFRAQLRGAALQRLWLATAMKDERSDEPPHKAAWGVDLDVPLRSQMVYPDGGNVWCSPTSFAMVMAYYGHGEVIVADAGATGLPDASADVVLGEAMLTMQSEKAKHAIVAEAVRLLNPAAATRSTNSPSLPTISTTR